MNRRNQRSLLRRVDSVLVGIRIVALVLSNVCVAYAKSESIKKGGYTMTYQLTGTKNTAAGGITSANGATDVVAFLSIFSYTPIGSSLSLTLN